LLAKCFGIEGEKLDQRVQAKLAKVKAALVPVWCDRWDVASIPYRAVGLDTGSKSRP
jgi:hypothetical protein